MNQFLIKCKKNLHLLIIMSLLNTFITSCNNDDNDALAESSIQQEIKTILCKYGWETEWYEEFSTWGDNNMSYSKEKVIYYFFEDGRGIARTIMSIKDTCLGNSRYDDPHGFKYSITGNQIELTFNWGEKEFNDMILYYQNDGTLLYIDEYNYHTNHTKSKIETYDYEWLEKAKYEVMEDEERLKFSIGLILDETNIEKCTDDKFEYHSYLRCGISTLASDHLSSRKINELRCKVYIYEGKFLHQKNPLVLSLLTSDNDQCVIDGPLEIYRNANAKIEFFIEIYDAKTKKYEYFESQELTFSNNPVFSEDTDENVNDDGDIVHEEEQLQGYADGYEWIDLGLPSGTKWATMNVGATSEYEIGNYYMWAATSNEYWSYLEHPLINYNGINDWNWSKYNNLDGRKQLMSEDDAATMNWSNSWMTPTCDQFKELYKYCKIERFNTGTQAYNRYTGPNGKSIIIPLGGFKSFFNDKIEFLNTGFAVWTNEAADDEYLAKIFQSNIYSYLSIIEDFTKTNGCNVRAVLK